MIRPPPTSTLFPYTTLFRSNGTVSIRFGPHVVGRYAESGRPLEPPKGRGKDGAVEAVEKDRKSTRLNSSHVAISYAVFCLKKKKTRNTNQRLNNRNRSSIQS